ncbi:unnamed protein product [Prorocentrum cordatum]|uniref:Uncharacterized protein n=1 Tax=Prorocentrum cordatum TaxID=2364126 RepID=A0ABN9QZ02_9DINO|nr:unnamed protein product [Polarella glacialis]
MEQKAEEEMKRMGEELAADEADAREAEAAALRLEEEQGRKAAAAKRIEEENSRWLQDRHKEWMQERQARMDASIATAEAALGVEGGGDLDVRMQEQAELARQQHLKDEQGKLERERNEQLQKKREEVVKRMEDMKRKKEEAQHNAAKRRKLAEERIQAAQANLTATQKVIEASQKLSLVAYRTDGATRAIRQLDGAVDAAGGSAPETDDVTRVVRRELDRSRSRSPHPLDITPQLGSKGGRDVDGSAGKGELTAAPPPKTKQELLAEIENEADLITRDIASGHNADEMTMEFAAQRLVKIFNSDALKRIQELRAKDPLWAEEERRRTGQTDKTMDDEFTEFWETMQGKDFYFDLDESISNPAAAKWRRAKQADQKLADDYKEAKGWPAKAKFRRDWMEGQFTLWAAETKYKRGEINEKAESKDGQYIPLARIAVEYGGGLTGLRAAINWCQSCILLGGEHVEYCPRAKHLNYLHVVHKLTDTYKKTMEKWEIWTKSADPSPEHGQGQGQGHVQGQEHVEAGKLTGNDKDKDKGNRKGTDHPVESAAKAKAKGKSKAKAKQKATSGGGGGDGGNPGDIGGDPPEKKGTFLTEFRKTRTIQQCMVSDPDWSWASATSKDRNGHDQLLSNAMTDALDKVTAVITGDARMAQLFSVEVNEFKKYCLSDEEFEDTLKHANKTMTRLVEGLATENKKMLRQHQARMAD